MNTEREFTFSDNDFQFLSQLVKQRTGIVLGNHKRNMVYSRLVRRLRHLELNEFSAYCQVLAKENNAAEMDHLVNAITTNLTHFFREPHHFEHLAETLRTSPTQPKWRIWSAGCSSGAEPYSIAMVMDKALGRQRSIDAKILATDIDSNMLEIARNGAYSKEIIERIPPDYRAYAKIQAGSAEIKMPDSLQTCITFNRLNLLEDWPMKGPFDAIFCRNVVIYFDKETQRTLFNRFAEILKPDGWLYIGHSESLHQVSERFRLQGRTIYRKTH